MKIKIPNTEIQELLSGKGYEYPKYSTQIMNLANKMLKVLVLVL